MNLQDFLKPVEIEQDIDYIREGVPAKAYPKADCTVEDGVDELDQLRKVSSSYYFYGQILGEIETELSAQKANLTTRKSTVYLDQQVALQKLNARVTDKVLENLVNVDPQVVKIKTSIAKLEGACKKLETILNSLTLKQHDLLELSRRKSQELRTINHLT
jgi:hypothetical protein